MKFSNAPRCEGGWGVGGRHLRHFATSGDLASLDFFVTDFLCKCPEIWTEISEPFFCGPEKIQQNPRQISRRLQKDLEQLTAEHL